MSVYQWKGAGYGLPTSPGSNVTLVKRIDAAALIAAGIQSGLALVAAPNDGVALASTGFAANDILEVFWVPKGTLVKGCGLYVITGEGATATIHAGVTSSTETHDLGGDIDGWFQSADIETAAAVDGTADNDGYGTDNYPAGVLYVTNGSIDIEFNNAIDAAIILFWADVQYIGTLV